MKLKTLTLAAVAAVCVIGPAVAAETRCGWLQNPTPGNWWLTDGQGQWIMMTQGSYEAEGMDLIGDISEHDYVANNGNYGYACACMDVDTNGQDTITKIHSFRQLRLAKCEKDSALPSPE